MPKCPECGTSYAGNVCPNCGYIEVKVPEGEKSIPGQPRDIKQNQWREKPEPNKRSYERFREERAESEEERKRIEEERRKTEEERKKIEDEQKKLEEERKKLEHPPEPEKPKEVAKPVPSPPPVYPEYYHRKEPEKPGFKLDWKFFMFFAIIAVAFLFLLAPLITLIVGFLMPFLPWLPTWLPLNYVLIFLVAGIGALIFSMMKMGQAFVYLFVLGLIGGLAVFFINFIPSIGMPGTTLSNYFSSLTCFRCLFSTDCDFMVCNQLLGPQQPIENPLEKYDVFESIKLGWDGPAGKEIYPVRAGEVYKIPLTLKIIDKSGLKVENIRISSMLVNREDDSVVIDLIPSDCTESEECIIGEEEKEKRVILTSDQPIECGKDWTLFTYVTYDSNVRRFTEFVFFEDKVNLNYVRSKPGEQVGPIRISVMDTEPRYCIVERGECEDKAYLVVILQNKKSPLTKLKSFTGVKGEGTLKNMTLYVQEGEGSKYIGPISCEEKEGTKKITGALMVTLGDRILTETERYDCSFEIINPEKIEGEVSAQIVAEVEYEYTSVVSASVNSIGTEQCSDDGTTNTLPDDHGQFCNVGNVRQKILDAETRYNIDKEYLLVAVAQRESSEQHCRNGRVQLGKNLEVGLFQLMPGKCGLSSEELADVDNNIDCAAKTLSDLYEEYKNGVTKEWLDACKECCHDSKYQDTYIGYKEWDAALRAYNGWNCYPIEKVNYVDEVNSKWEALKYA